MFSAMMFLKFNRHSNELDDECRLRFMKVTIKENEFTLYLHNCITFSCSEYRYL